MCLWLRLDVVFAQCGSELNRVGQTGQNPSSYDRTRSAACVAVDAFAGPIVAIGTGADSVVGR